MEKVMERENEEAINLVHQNQHCRDTVQGYFLREDQAKEMLKRCHQAEALERERDASKRENLMLKACIGVVSGVLILACIGGVHAEAMTANLAWAMSVPSALGAVLCCLPKAREEQM